MKGKHRFEKQSVITQNCNSVQHQHDLARSGEKVGTGAETKKRTRIWEHTKTLLLLDEDTNVDNLKKAVRINMSVVPELRASITETKIECITCKPSRTKYNPVHEKN